MELTLQYFDGCPNWELAKSHLLSLASDPKLEITLRYQQIETPEAAEKHGFRGSPTILLNGVDPFASAEAPVGLSCRMFQTETGLAGSPSLALLREAIKAAQTN